MDQEKLDHIEDVAAQIGNTANDLTDIQIALSQLEDNWIPTITISIPGCDQVELKKIDITAVRHLLITEQLSLQVDLDELHERLNEVMGLPYIERRTQEKA